MSATDKPPPVLLTNRQYKTKVVSKKKELETWYDVEIKRLVDEKIEEFKQSARDHAGKLVWSTSGGVMS